MTGPGNQMRHARATALRQLVPDPKAPFLDAKLAGSSQRRVANQRLSRSVILSRTRQLVFERGLDDVHMNEVAERSGVSVQTVYNLVGNRQEMISSATNEWLVSMSRNAEQLCCANDLNVSFTMMELFWAASINQHVYANKLVQSRAHDRFLERSSVHVAKQLIAEQLRDLRAAGKIVRWVSVPVLAEALALSAQACINAWIAHPYDESRFHSALVNSCGLTLRGALAGEEIKRLERSFDGEMLQLVA